jgi:hypothetical protein
MSVPIKQEKASSGVRTIGSPRTVETCIYEDGTAG